MDDGGTWLHTIGPGAAGAVRVVAMIDLWTESEPVAVVQGDCRTVMRRMAEGVVDAIVTDPPYGLGFMGEKWDHGVPGVEFWQAVFRVLKPGGYMLAMGGTRTYHRLACAIEDAGFELRDCLMWIYGTGFPKGKGCLKPAYEPILLARKPGAKVLPLGIDECRIDIEGEIDPKRRRYNQPGSGLGCGEIYGEYAGNYNGASVKHPDSPRHHALGRWPANVVLDDSDEVKVAFAAYGKKTSNGGGRSVGIGYGSTANDRRPIPVGDSGTAARFFYMAKASRAERDSGCEGDADHAPHNTSRRNTHPCVKPVALMRWLVKLVTPKDGLVLDPFAGSGTTGKACQAEGRRCVLIEKEPAFVDICKRRIAEAMGRGPGSLFEVVA